MIDILLSHWATYLLVGWILVCVVGNMLTGKKSPQPSQPRIGQRRLERSSPTAPLEDESEVAQRQQ